VLASGLTQRIGSQDSCDITAHEREVGQKLICQYSIQMYFSGRAFETKWEESSKECIKVVHYNFSGSSSCLLNPGQQGAFSLCLLCHQYLDSHDKGLYPQSYMTVSDMHLLLAVISEGDSRTILPTYIL
jgi:hypothetical protein